MESFSDENDGAIPDVVQEAIALKDTKKKVKAQRAYDKGMSALPDLDATVEGKRSRFLAQQITTLCCDHFFFFI